MGLIKGAKRCFEWLQTKKSGDIVPRSEVLENSGWDDVSLKTYLKKNKLAPFMVPLPEERLKILQNGQDITEQYFLEVFTQTAPRKILLSAGMPLKGESSTYKLLEPLGQGAIGHVWSAQVNESTKLVAAKVMLPREDLLSASKIADVRHRFRREAKNGKSISHPNIVKYLDFGDEEKNPFLIMELGVQSIARTIELDGALALEDVAAVMCSVAPALGYLHRRKCIHRDVKPDNIIVFD